MKCLYFFCLNHFLDIRAEILWGDWKILETKKFIPKLPDLYRKFEFSNIFGRKHDRYLNEIIGSSFFQM